MSKVLVVDDDPVIVEVYRRKLLQEGFEVEIAKDGLEALNQLQGSAKPDLVLLDLMMPRFNGFEVLKFIRSQSGLKDTRVVVLSNFYFGATERQAAAADADASLLKSSSSPAVVMETVKQVLAGGGAGPAAPPSRPTTGKEPAQTA